MTEVESPQPPRLTDGVRGTLVAGACYVALFLAFFWRSLGTSRYIAPGDSLDFGVAAFLSPQEVWTDGMYAGYPIAADPQSMMWYPVFRMFIAAGFGWNLFLLAAFPIAGLTLFLFVRRLTGSFIAALFAGLVYSFSGTMLAHLNHWNQIHTAAWIPVLLYGVQRVRDGETAPGVLVGSAGLALTVLAGHPQEMVYGVYLTCAFAVFCICSTAGRSVSRATLLAAVAAIFALGFGLAAIQLWPARELAALGTRAESSWTLFVEKSFPPAQLVTLLVPLSFGGFRHDFAYEVPYFGESSPVEMTAYFGLLPLLLGAVGVWRLPQRRREAVFWVTAAAVALLAALGDATPLAGVAFHLPLYGSFRVPARHTFIVALCGAVAAGIVLSVVLAERARWALLRRAGWYGFGAAALLSAVHVGITPEARRLLAENETYPLAYLVPAMVIFGLVALVRLCEWRRLPPAVLGTLLIALQAGDLAVLHYLYPGYMRFYAEVPDDRIMPRPRIAALRQELHARHSRVLVADGSSNAFLKPNLTRAWNVPSATGSGSMNTRRYRALVQLGGPGDVDPATLSTANLSLDLLRVEFAIVPIGWDIVKNGGLDPERWVKVDEIEWRANDPGTTYQLVRNTRILPRAWLVPEVRVLEEAKVREAVHLGRLPGGDAFVPSRTALVEPGTRVGLAGAAQAPANGCGSVSLVRESSRSREYSVSATAACFLVLSEVYYPWWVATIDGAPVDIASTDLALIGVPVPAGDSTVKIEIVPGSLHAGMAGSGVSGLVWLGVLLGTVRYRTAGERREGPQPPQLNTAL